MDGTQPGDCGAMSVEELEKQLARESKKTDASRQRVEHAQEIPQEIEDLRKSLAQLLAQVEGIAGQAGHVLVLSGALGLVQRLQASEDASTDMNAQVSGDLNTLRLSVDDVTGKIAVLSTRLNAELDAMQASRKEEHEMIVLLTQYLRKYL
jgi:HSP90 family molecular chaperone